MCTFQSYTGSVNRLALWLLPLGFLVASVAVIRGCGMWPLASQSAKARVIGDWVVIADTAGQGHTGKLILNADGTFTSTYTTKSSTETSSGIYKIGEIRLDHKDRKTVDLYFKTNNGKAVSDEGPIQLVYDETANILMDYMTVAYARPKEIAQAKKLFERSKLSSPAITGSNLKVLTVWKADFSPTHELRREVRVLNFGQSEEPQIVATDEFGWRIFDSSGRLLKNTHLEPLKGSELIVGKLSGTPILVEFGVWGSEVLAYDLQGKKLWSYQAPDAGIDWVAPVHLDTDNTGYAISYNGGGGVELLTPNGKKSWLADAPWNAWSVTGLPVGNSSHIVAAGSDKGAVAWDFSGKKVQEFAAGEVGSVGSADLDGDGQWELLTLGTTQSSGLKLSVFSADGKLKWSKKANSTESGFLRAPFVSGSFGSLGRMVGVADGQGIAFFEPGGVLKGVLKFEEGICSIAVLSRKGKPDALLVRLLSRLVCLEFVGS